MKALLKVHKTLLYLVGIAHGNKVSSPGNVDIDWKQVMELSSQQGVSAIVLDAINILNSKNDSFVDGIGKELHLRWIGEMIVIEQLYDNHKRTIEELARLFSKEKIEMMVLKGYGLSLNYPLPAHRTPGDIDIWLRGKQKEADALIEKEKGILPQKSSHHTIFELNGCEIENHITVLEHDTSGSNIKMDKYVTQLSNEDEEETYVNGIKVLLPSAQFNSVFLLRHNSGHFAIDRITIRHILDWANFVTKYYDDIDWDFLYSYAKKTNMHKFLDCQNAICVDYLGYSKELFPIKRVDRKLELRILHDILKPEFEVPIPSMRDHFIRYCVVKTKRLWQNRWKYRIVNKDNLVMTFIRLGINRLKDNSRIRVSSEKE